MRVPLLRLGLLTALLAPGPAIAGDAHPGLGNAPAGVGSAVMPYRFTPTPQSRLDPSEQQKALAYRMQLQSQKRELERLQSQGKLDSYGSQALTGTQSEINRIDRVLQR